MFLHDLFAKRDTHAAATMADWRAETDKELFHLYNMTAEYDNKEAQYNAGMCHLHGVGTPKDVAAAAKMFSRSARRGHVGATCRLGMLYETGEGVDQDSEEALAFYRVAGKAGHPEACYHAGRVIETGLGPDLPADREGAMPWYLRGAKLGDVWCQARAAELLLNQPDLDKKRAGAGMMVTAAEHGNPAAQYRLARVLERVDDVTSVAAQLHFGQLPARSVMPQMYKDSARGGLIVADLALGMCYLRGVGVPRDTFLAAHHLFLAADRGSVEATYQLALCHLTHCGVEPDVARGLHLMVMAARNGHAGARALLADWRVSLGLRNSASSAALNRVAAVENSVGEGSVSQMAEAMNSMGGISGTTSVGMREQLIRAGPVNMYMMMARAYDHGVGVEQSPAEATRCMQLAAQYNSIDAIFALGMRYETGQGCRRDMAAAVVQFQAGSEKGDHRATERWANTLLTGAEGVERDPKRACRLFQIAAEAGRTAAQYELGNCHMNGLGTSRSRALAQQWFTRAANQGHVEAMAALGTCLEIGVDGARDIAAAIGWFRLAAERGHAKSAERAATHLHAHGEYLLARPFFAQAAAAGIADAQHHLAHYLASGLGGGSDVAEAARLYGLAAAQGWAGARMQQAWCHVQLARSSDDDDTGVKHLKLAASLDDASAHYLLGLYLEQGRWFGRDFARAVKHYMEALRLNDRRAQYRLGSCYEAGRGLPRNEAMGRAMIASSGIAADEMDREMNGPFHIPVSLRWTPESVERFPAEMRITMRAVLALARVSGSGAPVYRRSPWHTLPPEMLLLVFEWMGWLFWKGLARVGRTPRSREEMPVLALKDPAQDK